MSNNNDNNELLPQDIRELGLSFQKSRIFLTAYELDVFTALGDKARSSNEVAKKLGADSRALDRLMNALCAMGLLKKKNGKFSNTPSGLRFLVKGRPEYMQGLMHFVHLWNNWSTLTRSVRFGRPAALQSIDERDGDSLTGFIAAMHERGYRQAPFVISMIDLTGVKSVLDIGGGSGVFSMAFARAKDDIKATVFDLLNVLPITKMYVEKEKLSDKINTTPGNYNSDEFPKGFDLVFLSAVIHSNSPKENEMLIKKCYKVLNPKGQIVVQDFIMDDDRVSPPHGALFALNMLVGTESGNTYTGSEVIQWLKNAGFSRITRKDTNFRTSLITGRKK
ncbi:MAG: methyltransferase [bacterium]|nr:methyltransferase [bacterium]